MVRAHAIAPLRHELLCVVDSETSVGFASFSALPSLAMRPVPQHLTFLSSRMAQPNESERDLLHLADRPGRSLRFTRSPLSLAIAESSPLSRPQQRTAIGRGSRRS